MQFGLKKNPPDGFLDHVGFDDHKKKSTHHEHQHILKNPFEGADRFPASSLITPADAGSDNEQDQGDDAFGHVDAKNLENILENGCPERILRKLPDHRGQENIEPPEDSYNRMELFPEYIIGSSLCGEKLMSDGREHHHSEEHGDGLHSEQSVSVISPSKNCRTC